MPRKDWTFTDIRELVEEKFGKRPCWFQLQVAKSIREGKDVMGCARTGAGKTLSFWIPLLMHLAEEKEGMAIAIAPLNLIGTQTEDILNSISGIKAIAINGDNCSDELFQQIESGKFNAVITSPEILMNHKSFKKLWKSPAITKLLQYFIFDEGHCITQWSSFRSEYSKLGSLRFELPSRVPFYVASATLPDATVREIKQVLQLRDSDTSYIMRSNDRPEIAVGVRPIKYAMASYRDLDFLVPKNFEEGDARPPPFLVFFNNMKEAEAACKRMRKRLPKRLRNKLRWFHSTMTPKYREDYIKLLASGDVWGFFATESFGLGLDVRGIKLIVQWKAPSDLCVLWQRFGRAARGPGESATAIMFVQSTDIHEERTKKAEKAESAAKKRKANKEMKAAHKAIKRKRAPSSTTPTSSKRPALGDATNNIPQPSTQPVEPAPAPPDPPSPSTPVEPSTLTVDIAEKRASYASYYRASEIQPSLQSKRKSGIAEGSPMYDFINAAAMGFSCRRAVASLYFGNDKDELTDHLFCDPTQTSGCSRCVFRPSTVCCDLCHPSSFLEYDVSYTKPKAAAGTTKSKLKAMDPKARDAKQAHLLKARLLDWREVAGAKKFHLSIFRRYGGKLLLAESLVDRLVLCARHHKINKAEDIRRETGWRSEFASEFSPEVLKIIHEVYPPPPVEAAPTESNSAPRRYKCGKCKQYGHNARSPICPMNKRVWQDELENVGHGHAA